MIVQGNKPLINIEAISSYTDDNLLNNPLHRGNMCYSSL